MDKPRQVTPDITVLPAHFPIPGAGFLPVNGFVIKAKEPVLVDAGMGMEGEEFMKALKSVIDPRNLKWVWITHDDADHTGNIQKVLEAAPGAACGEFPGSAEDEHGLAGAHGSGLLAEFGRQHQRGGS
jgi:glyoxylase-like metal-dependent hydrolase (beta-lactamase superfamily II)